MFMIKLLNLLNAVSVRCRLEESGMPEIHIKINPKLNCYSRV